ncbi:MAG TPA: alpha/beta hydrolase-fold protein [Gemmatimonadaceae bacterium]
MTDRPHTLTGDIRSHEFHSSQFADDRTVIVYVPPSYATSNEHYPVLYLHDGQNVFDQATAFSTEWGVDETAQELITTGKIEPLIIVGIYNAGERRVDEYTPTASAETGGGRADDYGRMLVEELKPFIDATYRTLPDVANTAMGGSSLGGLLTLHLGLRHPGTFGKLAVLSPSVWWDERVIVREVEALAEKPPQRIWLDAGTREGPDVIPDVRRLRDALVSKGWVIARDLMYGEARGGEHNERSWSKRVGPFLKFLFPPRRTL